MLARETRAEAGSRWTDPVTGVRFVDDRRADALHAMGIHSVGDLIQHFPFRYLDLSTSCSLAKVRPGQDVTVTGTVHEIKVKHPRPRLTITEVALVDGSGAIVGVWFNQPYVAQRLRVGERVAFAGRVEMSYGLKQIKTPFIERLDDEGSPESLGRVIPIHRATEGLSTNWVRRLVTEALRAAGDIADPLPVSLRVRRGLMSLRHALRVVHFPRDIAEMNSARKRLAYQELLILQAGLLARKMRASVGRAGHRHTLKGERYRRFTDALPFELTRDQRNALDEVATGMADERPMSRMLLGDVGTGKTAVATGALSIVADSGTQAAMMAPTEVLAAQYAEKIGPVLDSLDVSWRLLTGSTPAAERRDVLETLEDGRLTVVFGTHALIQEDVRFSHLTLVIVDEQHRFGVTQRLALRSKGQAADLLVMTATPIPRSLALTVYGDLDTSYLRERPGGRAADHITTRVVAREDRATAYGEVREQVGQGHQVYIVCALVDESDSAQARAATSEAERLQDEVFPDLRVGLLTGQMSSAEKQSAMSRFRNGDVDVLVSTTVIEVGVDVPNATMMIVEDADRFGLAQLHQLRGRVGRGEHPGRVLLFADPRTDEACRRMEAIVSTNDGFELAEEDLRLRGEGDIYGSRQSGLPVLRLASVVRDVELIVQAREDAAGILEECPELDDDVHSLLGEMVTRAFDSVEEWTDAG